MSPRQTMSDLRMEVDDICKANENSKSDLQVEADEGLRSDLRLEVDDVCKVDKNLKFDLRVEEDESLRSDL